MNHFLFNNAHCKGDEIAKPTIQRHYNQLSFIAVVHSVM